MQWLGLDFSLDAVMRANAERLERQAERLIGRGYRVEELMITLTQSEMAANPARLSGNVLTVPAWGNIEARPGGPGAITLAARRAWRRLRPYRPQGVPKR